MPEGQPKRLMEQVRDVLRLHRYALRTEKAYGDWIRRYVTFHGMKSRADLADGRNKVEAFLTDLAVRGQVAASTQNQALNALMIYTHVLRQGELGCAVRWMGERRREGQRSAFNIQHSTFNIQHPGASPFLAMGSARACACGGCRPRQPHWARRRAGCNARWRALSRQRGAAGWHAQARALPDPAASN